MPTNADIKRYHPDGTLIAEHRNRILYMSGSPDMKIEFYGPKYGPGHRGIIRSVGTSYQDADYDLSLTVLRLDRTKGSRTMDRPTYKEEYWYVRLLEPAVNIESEEA